MKCAPITLTALLLAPLAALHAGEPTVLLRGLADTEVGVHGAGNVYAPEIHRRGDR